MPAINLCRGATLPIIHIVDYPLPRICVVWHRPSRMGRGDAGSRFEPRR